MSHQALVTTKASKQQLTALTQLDEQTKEYARKSLSDSTHKAYKNDFRIFSQWCESLNINPCPATPETIARFLTAEADKGIRPATLIRRMAAIRFAHEALGYATPTQHKGVQSVLKGIKRDKGTVKNKKTAATIERISNMIKHCPDTLTGLRDKALLLLGFGGAFRRSELVTLEVRDIESTPEGIKVTIRKSKTDQEGQSQTIAILNGTNLRIVDSLNAWLHAASITEGLLFRAIHKSGSVQAKQLNTQTVADIVKRYASKAGFTVAGFSGHSLRSGFITSGAMAGADIFKLMEVSRHKKPETVMGYVRESKLFENHAGEKFL